MGEWGQSSEPQKPGLESHRERWALEHLVTGGAGTMESQGTSREGGFWTPLNTPESAG